MSFRSASSNNGNRPQSRQLTIQRVVVAGYIIAVAMPPLGLLIGLILTVSRRLRSRHGAWIVLVSIGAAVIWALLIASGALNETDQGY